MSKCIAMILAGGQGARLEPLTNWQAKPALPFGGKYKIIDWTLSNVANSGIDTVGVLTQYQPLELNTYINDGSAWGLNYKNKGVTILPPYMDNNGGDWYLGTANAIYQNIKYIDSTGADYVLILSGDHVYSQDYSKMLEYHIKKGVSATVSVIDVPKKDASRFGIMKVNKFDEIIEFQEKPAKPDSTLASMGIYIFNWDMLKRQLIIDANNEYSSHDFGKNIIPQYLKTGERICVYEHDGYWMDVGTIDSYYKANMDALTKKLNINDKSWKLFGNFKPLKPTYVSPSSSIEKSLVAENSYIEGSVYKSIVSSQCKICENADVKNSILGEGVFIGEGAKVYNSILSSGVRVGMNAVIGEEHKEITVLGQDVCVPFEVVVPAGTRSAVDIQEEDDTLAEELG